MEIATACLTAFFLLDGRLAPILPLFAHEWTISLILPLTVLRLLPFLRGMIFLLHVIDGIPMRNRGSVGFPGYTKRISNCRYACRRRGSAGCACRHHGPAGFSCPPGRDRAASSGPGREPVSGCSGSDCSAYCLPPFTWEGHLTYL